MSFYSKIKAIAETMTGYTVTIDTSNGANIDFDNMVFPCIFISIQQSGTYNTNNSHYRDSANVRISTLNKIPQDFNSADIDTIKETLKTDLVTLQHKIRYNFDFKINATDLKYDLVYDEYDTNLLGVVINDTITERVGLNLACTLTPQPQSILVIVKDQDGNTLGTYTQNGTYTINVTSDEMNGRYINETFTGDTITLVNIPISGTEELHIDGTLQTVGLHYTITGLTITLLSTITESSVINCPYKYL